MKNQFFDRMKKTSELTKYIESIGYRLQRQTGSHMIYNNGKQVLSIPAHRDLSDGTKRNLMKLIIDGG